MTNRFNYRAVANISLSNISHNLNLIKNYISPNSKVLAMIKANAYGHGLFEVANSLEKADMLGMACCSEAYTLRENKVMQDIILMQGVSYLDELEYCFNNNCQIVINTKYHVELINRFSKKLDSKSNKKLIIWLKINSGMNRLGFSLDEFYHALNELSGISIVKVSGFIGHFSNSDDLNKSNITDEQSNKYFKVLNNIPRVLGSEHVSSKLLVQNKYNFSLCNSAATLFYPHLHHSYIRPGLLLYGACRITLEDYLKNKTEFNLDVKHQEKLIHLLSNLKPAMSLYSEVISKHSISKGDSVGYGSLYTSEKSSTIVIVGIGYGDGFPREIAKDTKVFINGKLYPIVGSVSMDMLNVDVGNDNINIGDKVEIFGDNISVTTLAKSANTISYTILTGLSSRVKVTY